MVIVGPGRSVVVLPAGVSQAVVDLLLVVLSVAAAVLLARRVVLTVRAGGDAREVAPWAAYAAGMASYSAAQVRFAWVELVVGGNPRGEPLTNLGYLVAAALVPVAMVLAVRAAHASTSRVRTLLDGLLAGGGLLLLGWLWLVAPALNDGGVTVRQVILPSSSVVSAVAVLTAALVMAARCRPSLSVQLLAAGCLVSATSQVLYLMLVRSGTFVPGGWTAVLSAISLVLLTSGAVVRRPTGVGAGRASDRGPIGWLHAGLLAGLPYLPLLIAVPAVLVVATHRQIGVVELAGTLLLTTVLLLRQALVVVENRRLAGALQERTDVLARLAYRDQLTGLANRAAFTAALDDAVARASVHGRAVVVAFCDLDGFKAVNDACGHAQGDALLVAVAARLQQVARADDVVARLGGDEFAVLIRDAGTRDDDGALAAADLRNRLHVALSVPFSAPGDGDDDDSGRAAAQVLDQVSASIGAVSSSELVATGVMSSPVSADELLREADHRMYAAKRRHHAARAG
ncbi:diguanylate cyclase (GGDEF) domain-containing protein [Quadrisphaera granulorum]|uniref:Diguanylate cyclase (GGDEF)-like protein n=2 Tax=Quadrisphaera granulorum TaxID=317664 RepID=A0A315ZU27_9ACTN|nr:diguanylate cyclase (GGDEF)-like protein [Quadrisphaera granulorum]SZE98294.1 diguanylate cyclase (GGDEF) domain-containing protein [Quadrisphaera granulorum]